MVRFAFGQNWSEFSTRALTAERIDQARRDFLRLVDGIELRGRQFLDIGFGQGLGLLTAAAAGARVVGCDIDPQCGEVLVRNQARFAELGGRKLDLEIGSILDPGVVERLRARTDDGTGFDLVGDLVMGACHRCRRLAFSISSCDLIAFRGQSGDRGYHWLGALQQVDGRCGIPGSFGRRNALVL